MQSLSPVLSLLRGFFAPKAAWLVRLHASQIRVARDGRIAPAALHRRIAFALAALERP